MLMVANTMNLLDWCIMAVYGVGMLVVGYYFARRTENTEDYMLGGRRMASWMVGLSLFATLFSALTYLANPGEMIKHGPMICSGLISFPVFYLVVGYWLIPRIMKYEVTSAYELLEIRLGLSVRMLAAVIFLAMRIIWMAMIIYMSADKVIVPIMNWPESAVIYVCIVLGIITVIYTSMGGLRAVVLTDVIQSFILFGGALLTIVVISVHLGGLGAWWPTEWAAHWDKPYIFHNPVDPDGRTFFAAFISFFCWYVCTAGSDQMAIQRYLATRNAKTARRAFLTTTVFGGLVTLFVSIVGLALLAYFQRFPGLLPEGKSVSDSADVLFPLFIVKVLPPGIRALVIAGLLAASMSSLSSGVNSSCLVINKDFVRRFSSRSVSQKSDVRSMQRTSVVIGIVVVLLSTVVGKVPGNLMAQLFRTINLFVGPLFVPFFVVFFMPRVTGRGAFLGIWASIAAAVIVAYWIPLASVCAAVFDKPQWAQTNGISFLWIIPGSFLVGVLVSYILSLPSKVRSA